MFGYVRPVMDKMSDEDRRRFQAAYCGLCHVLGKRYGTASRLVLNYDFTFLAILLSCGKVGEIKDFRCAAEGFRKRCMSLPTRAIETAADESVVLAWWKIRDEVADSSGAKAVGARAASAAFAPAYRKACAACADFDKAVSERLSELSALESEKCPSIDMTADKFALILKSAGSMENEDESRVLAQLLYHLGRWIYLMDAVDDLPEDCEADRYNPLRYRFETEGGKLSASDRERLIATIDHSVNLVTSAYQLIDAGEWSGVLDNILYLGLPAVGSAVMSGEWKKKNRRYDEETV